MTTKITREQKIADCAACKTPIVAVETFEVGDLEIGGDGSAVAATRLVGTLVDHDCRPKVTRKKRTPAPEPKPEPEV